MKILIFLSVFCTVMACNQPKTITANPDDQTATSGTLGSVKATNEMPRKSGDTTLTEDSLKRARDSVRPN